MNKQFKIFSNHVLPMNTDAKLADGSIVKATIDSIEIQLVPTVCNSGTIKLVFTNPDEQAEAAKLFIVDTVINVTFATGE